MTHVAEEGNPRRGDMTPAEITQSVLGETKMNFGLVVSAMLWCTECAIFQPSSRRGKIRGWSGVFYFNDGQAHMKTSTPLSVSPAPLDYPTNRPRVMVQETRVDLVSRCQGSDRRRYFGPYAVWTSPRPAETIIDPPIVVAGDDPKHPREPRLPTTMMIIPCPRELSRPTELLLHAHD